MSDQILSKSAYTAVINAPIEKHGVTLEQAVAARQTASSDHNSRETPLFAKSIERKALAKHRD